MHGHGHGHKTGRRLICRSLTVPASWSTASFVVSFEALAATRHYTGYIRIGNGGVFLLETMYKRKEGNLWF